MLEVLELELVLVEPVLVPVLVLVVLVLVELVLVLVLVDEEDVDELLLEADEELELDDPPLPSLLLPRPNTVTSPPQAQTARGQATQNNSKQRVEETIHISLPKLDALRNVQSSATG